MEIKTFSQLKTLMEHELETKPDRRIAALKTLFQYQTASERCSGKTHVINGEGFNKADAPTLTSLLIDYNNKGKLTERQHKLLYYKLKKYAGQLCRISINKKLIQKVYLASMFGVSDFRQKVRNSKQKKKSPLWRRNGLMDRHFFSKLDSMRYCQTFQTFKFYPVEKKKIRNKKQV